MLSPKQIGTICFIFSILIFPTYATINVQPGSTADCNSSTLTTSDDNVTANLTAQYHANTISVTYDAKGGTTSNGETWTNDAATQCEYDTNFNLPTAPSKTGYNFDGWKVKTPECLASSVCGINSSTICGLSVEEYGYKNDTRAEYDGGAYNDSRYGLTSDYTWAVELSNGGIIRGEASCNDISDNNFARGLLDSGLSVEEAISQVYGQCSTTIFKPTNRFTKTLTGQYCWCKMTSYTPNGGVACNVAAPFWVFYGGFSGGASDCATSCAYSCSDTVQNMADFRRAVMGISGTCN